ncbi:MAG: 2-succinylbenzoate-CoA ligase [Candidatus Hydrogenedentota bacterium]
MKALEEAAVRWPDRPFLKSADQTLSFRDTLSLVQSQHPRTAQSTLSDFVRVAIEPEASVSGILRLLAHWRTGVCTALLNPRWPSGLKQAAAAQTGCVLEMGASGPPVSFRGSGAPATIVFTSGSSGSPKAAVHSLNNHLANAIASNGNIRVLPGDAWLLSLPLYHVSGLGILFRCLAGGACVVLPGDAALGEAIHRFAVTHVSMVSTQLHRMLQKSEDLSALRSLKAILLGGSAIPRSTIEMAHEHGLPLFKTYGMTETASQIATTRPGATIADLLSGAPPIVPGSVRLTGEGEIQVRGETLFLGYLNHDEIVLPMDAEGWFSTGDLGELDDQGRLMVTGRKDNMFISGGENILPEEIEQCLMRIPGIVQAFVVPVQDEEYGQRPVAFIETDGVIEADVWKAQLREWLPPYKVPLRFEALPTNPTGLKVSRADLQTLADRMRSGSTG